MARSATDTKNRILTVAYGLFYKEGFARVSVDAIAEAAGVTKRTLYYHFKSKDELAAEVLDHQHTHALRHIQSWGGTSFDSPAEFLETLFERLEHWAAEPKWLGSGFTRITLELADLPGHPARGAARQHKATVERWLEHRLTETGAERPQELAQHVMLLIEGCLSLILIHGDTTYANAAAQAARTLASTQRADKAN